MIGRCDMMQDSRFTKLGQMIPVVIESSAHVRSRTKTKMPFSTLKSRYKLTTHRDKTSVRSFPLRGYQTRKMTELDRSNGSLVGAMFFLATMGDALCLSSQKTERNVGGNGNQR